MRENAGFTIMAREKTVMSGSGSGLEFKDMTVFTIKPKSRSLNEERPEAGLREVFLSDQIECDGNRCADLKVSRIVAGRCLGRFCRIIGTCGKRYRLYSVGIPVHTAG